MITTAIVGDLFIVMDPNGELVTVVGGQQTLDFQQIFALLKAQSGDYYDTMSCYLDTGSGVLNLGSAADTIYQDASGIGRWTFDFRSTWSSARLQHYSYYSFFDAVTFLQEFGHRWAAYAKYATSPGTPGQTLLHQDWIWTPGGDGQHWGRWFDDGNSSMDYDQAEWIDIGGGQYNRIDRDTTQPAQAAWFGYCPLDQYLMGLIPASDVAPMKVLQNPTPALSEVGPQNVPTGPYTPSAITTVTIAEIQNSKSDDPSPVFSGPRSPDYLASQRVFHNAIVVVSKNTSTASTFITNGETLRQGFTTNIRRVTSGRMMVDTSLLRSNYTDLYVKDNSADTGATSSTGTFWETPDLVTRNTDDNIFADQPVIRQQDNWIYVRVRNKGATAYANVTVNVYLANFVGTEFLYPVDWNPTNLLGSQVIASLPAASGGVDGTAIAKFQWLQAKIPPAAGWHPCVLVEVIPMETAPIGLHHVWENRKLAQKNVTIIDMIKKKSAIVAFELMIGHPLRRAEGTHLQIEADRADPGVRLFFDPAGLIDDLAEHATRLEWDIPLDPSRIPSGERGVLEIEPPAETPKVIGHPRGAVDGVTLDIQRGTEIGVDGLRLRFEDDVRIRVGGAAHGALERRHAMRGLKPVVLNGLPLLEITEPKQASLSLPLPPGDRRNVRLFAVTTRPLSHPVRYRISERIGDRVIGGATLQLGE
jgi:hypothetical protein